MRGRGEIPGVTFPCAREAIDWLGTCDLHSHSTFVDGRDSVEAMVRAAEAAGLGTYALTEHVRTSARAWWPDYVEQIRAVRASADVQVLVGMEVNAIGPAGNVDVTPEMWADAEIVLGSVHGYYVDDTWEKIPDGSLPRDVALEYEVEKTIGLAHNERIDVLAHPGYIFERHYGGFPEDALRRIVCAARDTGAAVEITYPFMRDPGSYFAVLLEENPRVSIGSNAHRREHVGRLAEVLPPLLGQ